jgi:mono/diheme cytochrome c family protein
MNRGARVLITILLAVAVTFLATIGGQLAASQQQPASLQPAEQTFQARCSTCHAEHGEGSEAGASLNVPDLRSQHIQQQNDEALRRVIKEGRGDMPMFKRDFSDDEISQLIKLVRSFARLSDNASAHESSNGSPATPNSSVGSSLAR